MEIVLHFYITSYAIENSPILWYNRIALYLIECVYCFITKVPNVALYLFIFCFDNSIVRERGI
jgi:hypothetical protein